MADSSLQQLRPRPLPPPPQQQQQQRVRRLPAGQSLTVRGVAVGLAVGLVVCFSNMYFGLQTGWHVFLSLSFYLSRDKLTTATGSVQ